MFEISREMDEIINMKQEVQINEKLDQVISNKDEFQNIQNSFERENNYEEDTEDFCRAKNIIK